MRGIEPGDRERWSELYRGYRAFYDQVRWITADDNATARRLYDSVGGAIPFVTYVAPAAQ